MDFQRSNSIFRRPNRWVEIQLEFFAYRIGWISSNSIFHLPNRLDDIQTVGMVPDAISRRPRHPAVFRRGGTGYHVLD
jgi:hypothetical protein